MRWEIQHRVIIPEVVGVDRDEFAGREVGRLADAGAGDAEVVDELLAEVGRGHAYDREVYAGVGTGVVTPARGSRGRSLTTQSVPSHDTSQAAGSYDS